MRRSNRDYETLVQMSNDCVPAAQAQAEGEEVRERGTMDTECVQLGGLEAMEVQGVVYVQAGEHVEEEDVLFEGRARATDAVIGNGESDASPWT